MVPAPVPLVVELMGAGVVLAQMVWFAAIMPGVTALCTVTSNVKVLPLQLSKTGVTVYLTVALAAELFTKVWLIGALTAVVTLLNPVTLLPLIKLAVQVYFTFTLLDVGLTENVPLLQSVDGLPADAEIFGPITVVMVNVLPLQPALVGVTV